MKNSKIILIGGVSILTLAGCSHPNAMPSGYTHHHDRFKSPDSSVSGKVASFQSQEEALSQMGVDQAVEDLLRKITARAGVSPKPVYVLTPEIMEPFYIVVDSALRKNMRDLGYAISNTETGAYAFAYTARNLSKPRGTENDGYPNVELMLKIYDSAASSARLLTEQAGNYYIEGAQNYTINPVNPIINSNWNAVPVPVTTTPASSYYSESMPAPAPRESGPTKMEIIERPIVPTVEYDSFSKEEGIIIFEDEPSYQKTNTDYSDVEYGERRSVNEQPLTTRARVSKHIDY